MTTTKKCVYTLNTGSEYNNKLYSETKHEDNRESLPINKTNERSKMFITRKEYERTKKDIYELIEHTARRQMDNESNLINTRIEFKSELGDILETIKKIPEIQKYKKTLDLMLNQKKKGK